MKPAGHLRVSIFTLSPEQGRLNRVYSNNILRNGESHQTASLATGFIPCLLIGTTWSMWLSEAALEDKVQLRVSPPAFIGILIFKIAAREKKKYFFLQ